MATGLELKNGLDPNLQTFNDRLDELVRVLVGDFVAADGAGPFDPSSVWPDEEIDDPTDHAGQILETLRNAPVDPDLKTAIDTLLGGLPSGDTIQTAVDALIDAVERAIQRANDLREQLGGGERISAFRKLNEPHEPGRYGVPNFGFFPALGDLIAVGDGVSLEEALAPLAVVAGAIESGNSYVIFVHYALGALDLLQRAFDLSQA
ncbi:MAG: hypothetical protein AAF560_33695, partial [Acidobacteriota bacterium]